MRCFEPKLGLFEAEKGGGGHLLGWGRLIGHLWYNIVTAFSFDVSFIPTPVPIESSKSQTNQQETRRAICDNPINSWQTHNFFLIKYRVGSKGYVGLHTR